MVEIHFVSSNHVKYALFFVENDNAFVTVNGEIALHFHYDGRWWRLRETDLKPPLPQIAEEVYQTLAKHFEDGKPTEKTRSGG